MGEAQFEKVCKELEELRNFADTDVHPTVSPENWGVYSDLCDLIDEFGADALSLIRQQQERIAELEANRDAVASKTSDLVGYLANLATTTKYFHGDHVDIPLDVYAECIFRLNKYYKRCEEMEAAQTARVMTLEEVKTLNHNTVVWCEHKGVHPPRPRVVHYANDDHITFTDGSTWNFEMDGYGSHWRLWTQRPTDEQREDVQWN